MQKFLWYTKKAFKKIKRTVSLCKTYAIRFFKSIHPRTLRRSFKYFRARSRNGHTDIDNGVREYIDTLIRLSETPENALILRSNEKVGKQEGRSYLSVPLSQARFLEVFTKTIGAKNALEIGTFRGFSTGFMARGLKEGGVLFACDEDSRPEPFARRFWQALGVEEKIHFEIGEAKKVLARLTTDAASLEFFDLVFIDADKENYKHYVTESMKLLKTGGSMLVDNTLWKGLVQYKDSHDNGTEHIKEFNTWVFGTYKENASLVPAWDGLTLIVKK